MYKLLMLLVLSSVVITTLKAQCPDNSSINFYFQDEITQFGIDYPQCTELSGSLRILGADITDLSGISQIRKVGQYFRIENTAISSIPPLKLNYVGRDFHIRFNENLTSLSGFDSLKYIGEDLILGEMHIQNLSGLSNLDTLIGVFLLTNCDSITSLTGLENMHKVYNLMGQNAILATNNPKLSSCSIDWVCAFIDSFGTSLNAVVLTGNATGCSTIEEVLAQCVSPTEESENEIKLSVLPNPAYEYINVIVTGNPCIFRLYDSVGKLAFSQVVGLGNNIVSIEHQPSGLLFWTATTEKNTFVSSGKLLKQ